MLPVADGYTLTADDNGEMLHINSAATLFVSEENTLLQTAEVFSFVFFAEGGDVEIASLEEALRICTVRKGHFGMVAAGLCGSLRAAELGSKTLLRESEDPTDEQQ